MCASLLNREDKLPAYSDSLDNEDKEKSGNME
jgi:hypothetical protein